MAYFMSEELNRDYCCAFSSQLQDLLPLLSAEQKNDAKTSNKRATNDCEVLRNPVLLTHLTLIQAELFLTRLQKKAGSPLDEVAARQTVCCPLESVRVSKPASVCQTGVEDGS